MDMQEVINYSINKGITINITLTALDLKQWGESISQNTIESYIAANQNKLYSRKEVTEKFGICEATLWRWDKMGLIESKKIGNRVFYPESEIKRLSSVKS